MIKTTDKMVEAAAKVLNNRLSQNNGLAGVSRDIVMAVVDEINNDHEERLQKLEKWAHEPFDFSDLIRRLEVLEKAHPKIVADSRTEDEKDRDFDRYMQR